MNDDEEDTALPFPESTNFHGIQTDIGNDDPSQVALADARGHYGPINILIIPNAAITDESHTFPIWETPLHQWGLTYRMGVQGTLAIIRNFLRLAKTDQQKSEAELPNLAIVISGTDLTRPQSPTSPAYMSGTPGVLHGLVQAVSRDLQFLNSKARINVLAHV